MKTIHVTLEWNKPRKQWDMLQGIFFVQEWNELSLTQKIIFWILKKILVKQLFDCGTINHAFSGLCKYKTNKYKITIEEYV